MCPIARIGRLAAAGISMLAAPGPAWACSVCFTSERSGSLLRAYYLTTALLTTTVLGILAAFFVVFVWRYAREERARSLDPIKGRFSGENAR